MGLMRIQKNCWTILPGGSADSISCRIDGKADGLPAARECSSGFRPAVLRARATAGCVGFPTTKGLASVDPAELKPNLRPPLVMIESVLVDGKE